MNHVRNAFFLFGAMLLTGCVAVWGAPYKVEAQSADAMTVHYDTHFIDRSDIQTIARDHCNRYGKDAAIQSDNTSAWGLSTATFACHARMQPEAK